MDNAIKVTGLISTLAKTLPVNLEIKVSEENDNIIKIQGTIEDLMRTYDIDLNVEAPDDLSEIL